MTSEERVRIEPNQAVGGHNNFLWNVGVWVEDEHTPLPGYYSEDDASEMADIIRRGFAEAVQEKTTDQDDTIARLREHRDRILRQLHATTSRVAVLGGEHKIAIREAVKEEREAILYLCDLERPGCEGGGSYPAYDRMRLIKAIRERGGE